MRLIFSTRSHHVVNRFPCGAITNLLSVKRAQWCLPAPSQDELEILCHGG